MSGVRWWHGRRKHWQAGVELGYRLGKEAGEREAMTHGRCGAMPPTMGWSAEGPCELTAEHNGWHRCGVVEWGVRR